MVGNERLRSRRDRSDLLRENAIQFPAIGRVRSTSQGAVVFDNREAVLVRRIADIPRHIDDHLVALAQCVAARCSPQRRRILGSSS